MTEIDLSPQARVRPLPGTGRLGVVSAFFTLCAILGMGATAALVADVLIPSLEWGLIPNRPWLAVAGAALVTFGFVRTTDLLNQRKRTGAQLAAACLASSVAGSVFVRQTSWTGLVIPVVGIGLLASVWRHLE